MLSQLSIQKFGTSGPGFSIPAHSFAQCSYVSDIFPTHILLAEKALTKAFGKKSPRSLVLVRAMPYTDDADAAFVLAKRAGISPARVVSLGNQCSAIIDGFSIAATFAETGLSSAALVAADQFSELLGGEDDPSRSEWRNMAGCLRIDAGGRLKLRAIASLSDPELISMATLSRGRLQVDKCIATAFRRVDVGAQVQTIDALINLADDNLGRPFLCVTNRSTGRLSSLVEHIGERAQLIESRKTHGHTGGTDILLNLMDALGRVGSRGANIICSANGLGYTWSSALITVMPMHG